MYVASGTMYATASFNSIIRDFRFSTSSRPALRPTQPPIQWVPGALSPGLKRQGREAENSPPTSAEVKKIWIYTSSPPTPSCRTA
jgi:hypothetical protein